LMAAVAVSINNKQASMLKIIWKKKKKKKTTTAVQKAKVKRTMKKRKSKDLLNRLFDGACSAMKVQKGVGGGW